MKKHKLALNGINRGKNTLKVQRLECNKETGQQDSETEEHGNLEQQIKRRSYTGYRGLWKVNGVESRLQLGTGSGGGGRRSSRNHNNKNNIHHSQNYAEMTPGIKGSRSFLHQLL